MHEKQVCFLSPRCREGGLDCQETVTTARLSLPEGARLIDKPGSFRPWPLASTVGSAVNYYTLSDVTRRLRNRQ